MSRENVEVVLALFGAYSRGLRPEELTDLLASDIVWNPAEEAPSRGIDALSAYLDRWEAEWDELETRGEDFLDAGDRVVVAVYFKGRGKASGLEVDATLYEVYALRDGKVTRMDEFTERSEAFALAGLPSS